MTQLASNQNGIAPNAVKQLDSAQWLLTGTAFARLPPAASEMQSHTIFGRPVEKQNQLICKAGAPKRQPKHCVVDPIFSSIKMADKWRNVAPELTERHLGTTPAFWIAEGVWMPLPRQDEGLLLCPRPACYLGDKLSLFALWVRISLC